MMIIWLSILSVIVIGIGIIEILFIVKFKRALIEIIAPDIDLLKKTMKKLVKKF